jgi:hypothetical protein
LRLWKKEHEELIKFLDKTFTTKEKIADKLEGFFETVENSRPCEEKSDMNNQFQAMTVNH